MKKLVIVGFLTMFVLSGYSQSTNDFSLENVVSGNTFSLSQHKSATAVVLIFTSNTCPFSKLYESRILALVNQYRNQNYYFALVNPHAGAGEGESKAEMVQKSTSSMSGLPYLADSDQSVAQSLGISKIPEAVVITNAPSGFTVAYQGGIDNNPQLPQSVTKSYLADALRSIAEKKAPNPASTRSVGCNLRMR